MKTEQLIGCCKLFLVFMKGYASLGRVTGLENFAAIHLQLYAAKGDSEFAFPVVIEKGVSWPFKLLLLLIHSRMQR